MLIANLIIYFYKFLTLKAIGLDLIRQIVRLVQIYVRSRISNNQFLLFKVNIFVCNIITLNPILYRGGGAFCLLLKNLKATHTWKSDIFHLFVKDASMKKNVSPPLRTFWFGPVKSPIEERVNKINNWYNRWHFFALLLRECVIMRTSYKYL